MGGEQTNMTEGEPKLEKGDQLGGYDNNAEQTEQ